jgi:RNA-directed DNA polymerase
VSPRPTGLSLQENLENLFNEEKQMTAGIYPAGASSTLAPLDPFNVLNWSAIRARVNRLQMRIAKAVRDKRYGKVKALQWILTHSYEAKLLAVKRVTENRGRRTPGVDGILWSTPMSKFKAVQSIKRCGYKPQPLRPHRYTQVLLDTGEKFKYKPPCLGNCRELADEFHHANKFQWTPFQ